MVRVGRRVGPAHADLPQAVRTEWTGGRCSAMVAHVEPASLEPKTSPDVAPK